MKRSVLRAPCAIDATPGSGGLMERALGEGIYQQSSPRTITDLLKNIESVDSLTALARYMHHARRLHLIAGEQDPEVSDSLTAEVYLRIRKLFSGYFSVELTDCGPGRAEAGNATHLQGVRGGDRGRLPLRKAVLGRSPFLYLFQPCPNLDQTLAVPAANAELARVAFVHKGRTSRRGGGMTITEYAVALGGMLASLAGVGLLAAGIIKAKARH